jgi:light-regulated signal transduction histidine kinase (bacteriophytochrome)
VEAQPLAAGGWRLTVQDNGVGFDASRAQGLGELFQRMHREGEFAGVGCGLALVHTVAQRHGARWEVQSQVQAGCIVHLDWPVAV